MGHSFRRRGPVAAALSFAFLALSSRTGSGAEGNAYLSQVGTAADFEMISRPWQVPGVERITKFLVPAREDPTLLSTLFVNVNRYVFVMEFLAAEFPERFPGLTDAEYLDLVGTRATRRYFEGVLYRFREDPLPVYGFDVFTQAGSEEELPRIAELRWIYDSLRQRFTIGPLVYAPRAPDAVRNASQWVEPGFPILFPLGQEASPSYIPYTMGTGCGRVKLLSEAELKEANESGSLSSQEILVLDKAPPAIEGVIAGLITGEVQTELSDHASRMAARGAVNAFVKDAFKVFAPYRDRLVRLSFEGTQYKVEDLTLEEAQPCWAAHRPHLAYLSNADPDYDQLDATSDLRFGGNVDLVGRFGGQGANFARLHQVLPPEHRRKGFLIPFAYSLRFLQSNRARSPLDPSREVTLEKYVQEILADPAFRSDARRRVAELGKLREAIEAGAVDPETVRKIALRIEEVFGVSDRKVQFHSSSNAEDLVEFSSAGLHSPADACAADDLDGDGDGPSRCDQNQVAERGVSQALKRIWASLWTFRAYEEREHYQLDHLQTAAAVLVTEALPDEMASGVAFTGSPMIRGDERYQVIVQSAARDPSAAGQGDVPEKDVIQMKETKVAGIIRARPSTFVKPGDTILSDAQLGEIGKDLAIVNGQYPFSPGSLPPERVLLQLEFQLDRAGALHITHGRPFLIPRGPDETATLQLRVPEGIAACGSFVDGRSVRQVLATKARLALKPGLSVLRADGSSRADLFEWIQLRPEGPRFTPVGPGTWQVEDSYYDGPYYHFSMTQGFRVEGETLSVSVLYLTVPLSQTEIVLDPPALTWGTNPYSLRLEAGFGPEDFERVRWFLPCNLQHLPLWRVDLRFKNGDSFHFEERFQQLFDGTGPAELVLAEVTLGGRLHRVDDYWRLVYAAGYENRHPRPDLMAILDQSVELAGVGKVRAVMSSESFMGDEHRAFYLGENLEVLASLQIATFGRHLEGEPVRPMFSRGDADASQKINVTDAIRILLYLFSGARLDCPDAADVDDLGTVEINDAILLLGYLFLGQAGPAEPGPWYCGEDVNADSLPDCLPDLCWY